MSKAIRDIYGEVLKEYGAVNENIVVLDADVSGSTKSALFGKAYPERFYNCGIAESAMLGMAAGMAKNGKIPFVNTFAVFLTTLGLLGARNYMSYSGLNIKMMGAYGGLSDSYDGATHQSLEDISVMRALPEIAVMVASDEASTRWIVGEAVRQKTPMYIRLSRDSMPDCHPENAEFAFGKGMVVREGKDVTIIACGLMVSQALTAAEKLAKENISARVIDMYCIKPLDEELIWAAAEETGAVVTAEEHSVIGGLGSAVAEVLAKGSSRASLEMVGMKDCHGESGAYADLLKKYGLDAQAIVCAAKAAVTKKK